MSGQEREHRSERQRARSGAFPEDVVSGGQRNAAEADVVDGAQRQADLAVDAMLRERNPAFGLRDTAVLAQLCSQVSRPGLCSSASSPCLLFLLLHDPLPPNLPPLPFLRHFFLLLRPPPPPPLLP